MQRNRVRAVGFAFALACLPTALLAGGDAQQPAGGPTFSAVPSRLGTLLAVRRGGGLHRKLPVRARPKPPPPRPSKPITNVETGSRTLTLTFDDGPDPRWTPTVLDLLRQYHAKAIFCLVGLHAAANPALVRRIAAEGNVLCDHTWTHDEHLRKRPAATIEFEVGHTMQVIEQLAGVAPRYYRAPGGNWSPNMILVAQGHGLKPLGWAVDPADWSKPGTGAIIARVLGAVYPGAVVLMHDGYGDRSQSVAALRTLLPALAARGYRFTVPR